MIGKTNVDPELDVQVLIDEDEFVVSLARIDNIPGYGTIYFNRGIRTLTEVLEQEV